MRLRGTSGPKHRHLIGVTSVVIVVAAVTGGCIGLTSGNSGPSSTDGHSDRAHVVGASSMSTADAPTPGVSGGATGSAGSSGIACPMIPATTDPTGGNAGIGSATHVFTRTTADGVTIRTYRLPATGLCGCDPIPGAVSSGPASSGSATAPAMVTEGAVSIEMSDDTAVGEGTLFETFSPSATTANAGTPSGPPDVDAFGVVEGTPVWWTAVSVDPDVASAQMTFADGSTDQMVPVDGVVVLAHHIDPSVASKAPGPDVVRGTLRLLDSSGAVLSTVPVPLPAPVAAPPPLPDPVSAPMTISRAAAAASRAAAAASSIPTPSPAPGTKGAVVACPDMTAPTPPAPAIASSPPAP